MHISRWEQINWGMIENWIASEYLHVKENSGNPISDVVRTIRGWEPSAKRFVISIYQEKELVLKSKRSLLWELAEYTEVSIVPTPLYAFLHLGPLRSSCSKKLSAELPTTLTFSALRFLATTFEEVPIGLRKYLMMCLFFRCQPKSESENKCVCPLFESKFK